MENKSERIDILSEDEMETVGGGYKFKVGSYFCKKCNKITPATKGNKNYCSICGTRYDGARRR